MLLSVAQVEGDEMMDGCDCHLMYIRLSWSACFFPHQYKWVTCVPVWCVAGMEESRAMTATFWHQLTRGNWSENSSNAITTEARVGTLASLLNTKENITERYFLAFLSKYRSKRLPYWLHFAAHSRGRHTEHWSEETCNRGWEQWWIIKVIMQLGLGVVGGRTAGQTHGPTLLAGVWMRPAEGIRRP